MLTLISLVLCGSGDTPVTMTLTDDVGAAVVELVDHPVWEKYTYIHGETMSWNQIIKIGEEVTGILLHFSPLLSLYSHHPSTLYPPLLLPSPDYILL